MGVTNYEIRAMMLRYGLKQVDLAKILGTDQPTVSRMLQFELSKDQKAEIKEKIRREVEK